MRGADKLWTCPRCGAKLISKNPWHSCGRVTLEDGKRRMGPQARPLRVLMPICQKIGETGSGVVVRELVQRAARRGIQLRVLYGENAGDQPGAAFEGPNVSQGRVLFDSDQPGGLPFPIVGMSDRMPYRSSRFRDLTSDQVDLYLQAWEAAVRNAIEEFRPHLIHAHHLWLLAAACAAAAEGIPIFVSLHGTDLEQARNCPRLRDLVAPWVPKFTRFLGLSEASIAETRELYSDVSERFVVMGNGFSPELFRPAAEVDVDVLRRYGIPTAADRPTALFVGKYTEQKGIEWLIRAFGKVVGAGRRDARLVIAGSGPDTEKSRYLGLARRCGVAQRVQLTGQVRYQDVGVLMNHAKVFVLSSFQEPFGLVLLEALACGCRVVAPDQGGPSSFVPERLRASRDAIMIPGLRQLPPDASEAEGFVSRLADAMGEQLSKRLTAATRRTIAAAVKHLDWEAYLDRLSRLYVEALPGLLR